MFHASHNMFLFYFFQKIFDFYLKRKTKKTTYEKQSYKSFPKNAS